MRSNSGSLGADEGLAGLSRATEAKATAQLEKAVGGREAVRAALSHVTRSKNAEVLHAYLADPRNDKTALTDLCRLANVSVPDLWGFFKDGAFARAQVAALAKVAAKLPEVAGDVMARSVEHQVQCPDCHGKGRFAPLDGETEGLVCQACDGTGKVTREPDLKRQELALEIGGVLHPRGGGVTLNVNQNQFAVADVEQSFTEFQRRADRTLFDVRPQAPPSDDVPS